MFKGPAALTTGSTITTASATITGGSVNGVAIGGTTAAAGAFTTLGATGTITCAAVNASGTLTLAGNTNIVVSGGGTITGLTAPAASDHAANKGYVDQQISTVSGGGETPTVVAPASDVVTLSASGTSGSRLFIINGSAYSGNLEMTFDVSANQPADNSTWTFVWVKQSGGGASTGVKIDFGAAKLVSASGTNQRYLTLDDIGGSARVVYSSTGGVNQFFLIGGSGALLS